MQVISSRHYYKLILHILTLTLLGGAPASGLAQSNFIEKLDGSRLSYIAVDAVVSELMREAHVTGVQIAVFNDSIPKYVQSYGFRDADKSVPINNNTVFQAASLSKSMFATGVLMSIGERSAKPRLR